MIMRLQPVVLLVFFLSLAAPLRAQDWGQAAGSILAADSGEPVPGVSVLVYGTNFGTASQDNGTYTLRLPIGRYLLRFSAVGFVALTDSVLIRSRATTTLNVRLATATIELDEVTVEDEMAAQAGVYRIDPEAIRHIPMPIKDALRALKTMPGVVTNNELSNQYSVRGGGFNENLIFLNGFEIFLPFRPRNGEQEGLSLLNTELTERVTFYTAGFPARYGGKLSSAVDVEYRRPHRSGESFSGSAYASLLDMGFSAGSSALRGRLGWLFSARKARARRFFETQELKGNYQPDYTDLQGMIAYELASGHELELLGMYAEHEFRLDPSSRKTFFGTVSTNNNLAPSNLQSLWIQFDEDNEERAGYETIFGGLRLSNRLSPRLRIEHDVSLFQTREKERFELSGQAIIFLVDLASDNSGGGEGLFPIGSSRQEDFADNAVEVSMRTGQGRLYVTGDRHAAEAGYSLRRLDFKDRLDEKSVIIGRSTTGEIVRIIGDSLRDTASFGAWQVAVYAQEAVDVLTDRPGKLLLTGGLRADYYSFTDEWTLSPRLTATYRKDDETTLFGSLGIYYQAPTYRELRGKPEVGETILGALNRDLRSQRSMQAVAGWEYFIEQRRFYLRGEFFYKRISNVITYDIDNVRVRYSGENDAKSNTYGFDLQLRGEFVPGLESWVNYSYLVANEEFKDDFLTVYNRGTVSRPTDQRHTVSLFIQDYIPDDPTWRLHLRTLFGSGLPYTPPVPGPQIGNLVTQAPGPRFSARYPRYFRFDIGATKEIAVTRPDSNHPISIELTAELLNLFDMTNTVAYTWIPNAAGIWTRIPTRLTPRTLNVRLRVGF